MTMSALPVVVEEEEYPAKEYGYDPATHGSGGGDVPGTP